MRNRFFVNNLLDENDIKAQRFLEGSSAISLSCGSDNGTAYTSGESAALSLEKGIFLHKSITTFCDRNLKEFHASSIHFPASTVKGFSPTTCIDTILSLFRLEKLSGGFSSEKRFGKM